MLADRMDINLRNALGERFGSRSGGHVRRIIDNFDLVLQVSRCRSEGWPDQEDLPSWGGHRRGVR